MKVETEEGIWEVRKPFAREIFALQNLDPNNMGSEESYQTIKGILEKVIVSGPEKYHVNGSTKWYIDRLPADVFFTLFLSSCGSTLQVLQKLSDK